jgi:hypothetical protein
MVFMGRLPADWGDAPTGAENGSGTISLVIDAPDKDRRRLSNGPGPKGVPKTPPPELRFVLKK